MIRAAREVNCYMVRLMINRGRRDERPISMQFAGPYGLTIYRKSLDYPAYSPTMTGMILTSWRESSGLAVTLT